jgi:hypothetical protein
MRRLVVSTAAALCALSSQVVAAAAPIQFLPNQRFFACAKTTAQPQGGVCNANVLVGGGEPASGYTFSVRPGFTLPPGIALTPQTGVIKRTTANSPLLGPPGSTKSIHITVSDGHKTKNGIVSLLFGGGAVCGCPAGFRVLAGPIPLQAIAHVPYAVTLAVVGPPSGQALHPNYSWKVRAGSRLPPGLVLDPVRGVLRGTPTAAAKGKTYTFFVDVKELRTRASALSTDPYSLKVN